MAIFNSYVKLPEGNPNCLKQQDLRLVGTWPRGCRAVREGPLDGGAAGRSEAHHGLMALGFGSSSFSTIEWL